MMYKKKKGQAAMEFLMTYGWAILVVLAAIGALAYFGVLSPDRFLPEKCTLPSGFACLDFKQNGTGSLLLVVQNSAGFDMQDITVNVTDSVTASNTCQGAGSGTNVASNAGNLTNGQKSTYDIACSGLPSGKFKGSILIKYINGQTGVDHAATGELIMKVQ